MRISYDQQVDALMVVVRDDVSVARTVEVQHGLVDLDDAGEVVAFELLGASSIIEHVAELAMQPQLDEALADSVYRYLREARRRVAEQESRETQRV